MIDVIVIYPKALSKFPFFLHSNAASSWIHLEKGGSTMGLQADPPRKRADPNSDVAGSAGVQVTYASRDRGGGKKTPWCVCLKFCVLRPRPPRSCRITFILNFIHFLCAAGRKFGGFRAGIHSKISISKGFYTLHLDFFRGGPLFFKQLIQKMRKKASPKNNV